MVQGFELSGWVATLALSLPFVLLAISLLLGTRSRRKQTTPEAAPAPSPAPVPEPIEAPAGSGAPAAEPAVSLFEAEPRQATLPPAPPPPSPPVVVVPEPEPVESAAEEPPPPDPVEVARETATRLAAEIKNALSSGRESEAVSLYMGEAGALVAMGNRPAAADRLRKSILLSAARGMKPEHALARLELGDLARHDGDLTTACEHWSIARSLMHELKIADGIREAEGRIRNHGCPTDWVLNDF